MNPDKYNKKEVAFFEKVDIPFEQSKEDIWAKIAPQLTEQKSPIFEEKTPQKETKVVSMQWWKMTVAATMLLFVGTGLFCRLYTTTITTQKGEFVSHTLPDGSTIDLNAASSLAYQPYWWKINRSISFEGEGFFEVEKGQKFLVVSTKGTTQVLGTSFNISTRNNGYKVYCVTGKVKVTDNKNQKEAILTPNLFVDLDEGLQVAEKPTEQVLAWKNHKFNFEAEVLPNVLKELEQQYNISIQTEKKIKTLQYTGYFKKTKDPESILNLICQSFGFTFVKIDDTTYRIK